MGGWVGIWGWGGGGGGMSGGDLRPPSHVICITCIPCLNYTTEMLAQASSDQNKKD